MTALTSVAFIGNSLPRRCGIATFTTDLRNAVATANPTVDTFIVAMNDHGHSYHYPAGVSIQINDDRIEDYIHAANTLNARHVDVVSLQHEFGIFGGDAGGHILILLAQLTMPVVTTLHTVLATPTAAQRNVLERIVKASSKLIVMAEKGRELLRTVYGVAPEKIAVIPHGIPDVAFVEPDAAKAKLGFTGKTVILTFGLLSPNKGIEFVIDAMSAIIESRPDAMYVILGATHPNLIRQEGEHYRDSLVARARALGIEKQVLLLDQFVDQATLLDFIAMCDVYVTPYLTEAQMTSGTLAYSFGLGKAVVSTPYWHARELLAEGNGILVPFGDNLAIGREVAALLTDDVRREAMRRQAYAKSRSMTWEQTARRYQALFDDVRRETRLRLIAGLDQRAPARFPDIAQISSKDLKDPILLPTHSSRSRSTKSTSGDESVRPVEPSPISFGLPEIRLGYFRAMCDDTGLFQHAVHSVPDRLHGYCIDDNARALLVACALNAVGEDRLDEALTARFAAFVQHAWNTDTKRFRNFMSFNRNWLEQSGSEDSHGRTLWALGECALNDANPSRRRWAAALFAEALETVETFSSPRAWAFALLGLEPYREARPADVFAVQIQKQLADRLMLILSTTESSDWVWFEDGLAYDNARLPQALIVTGMALEARTYLDAGLRSLRWLVDLQTSAERLFRPVGSQSFGDKRMLPRAFDQQPLEATATISACLAAWRADGDDGWKKSARRALDWFHGKNDLSVSLVDPSTGSCRDGLHPDRANENRGGESVVSYLLSLAEMRQLARASGKLPHVLQRTIPV